MSIATDLDACIARRSAENRAKRKIDADAKSARRAATVRLRREIFEARV